MNTENRAQIATHLMFLESLSVSLKQFMNAQIVSEHSRSSTEIILCTTEAMKASMQAMRQIAIESEAGGDNGYPF